MSNRTVTLKDAEGFLRDIETEESILNGIKRVNVFKGVAAVKHLMNKKHLTSKESKDTMNILLKNHYIVRVRPESGEYVLDIAYEFNVNHEYIWIREGSQLFSVLIGLVILLCALGVAMFPIWPRSLKMGTGYLFYVILGMLIALLVITVVRLILNIAIRIFTGRSFWLFPNLFEDCGIIESFVPLYSWDASSAHPGAHAKDE